MRHRFFAETPVSGDQITLQGPQAEHATRVLRLGTGDLLTVFDGSGWEFDARVECLSRRALVARVLERREVSREPPYGLVLAVALPKGERQRWLAEKCVELGVRQLVPLVTRRGVAQPTSGALRRLERTVVEASKQCGRNRLMEIGEPLPFERLAEQSAEEPRLLRLLAEPRSPPLAGRVGHPTAVLAAIGPEGGFAPEEVAAATAAGWHTVGLGSRRLRIETAALVLAAQLQALAERESGLVADA